MARLRPASIAVLAVLALASLFTGSSALGAARAHRTRSCARARSLHSRVGAFRLRHHRAHPLRHRSCRGSRRRGPHHGTSTHSPRPHRRQAQSGAASPAGCHDADLRPNAEDIERVRAATICLINRERAAHGELALSPNGHLQAAAQAHTDSMVAGDYFEHFGPGGQSPLDRMRGMGYIYSPRIGYEIGENIAWGTGALGTPRAAVAAWMASPGHRANILNGGFRDSGIGVSPRLPGSLAHGAGGGIYTQDFGVIIVS